MIDTITPNQSLKAILSLLVAAQGDAERFLLAMKDAQLPSLSFSKVSAVEFCEYRYYLQHILHLDPAPTPEYFTKGRLMHQVIAHSYKKLANQEEVDLKDYYDLIGETCTGEDLTQLENAARVHLENLWKDYEIAGIETPFAMLIDPELPTIIGVIDLILRQDEHFIVIDHKTGHDFYPPDELQMAIYREYIYQHFEVDDCEFYYDHYRWVKNLSRIRKPAFMRSMVNLHSNSWLYSLPRIKHAYEVTQCIREEGWAQKNGECFRCPYRYQCRSG